MIRDIVIEARSFRSFDETKAVSREALEGFLDIARLCSSAMNRQVLKYRIVSDKDEVEETLALTRWAGALKDRTLPPEGHHPTAFIIVCCDTKIGEMGKWTAFDAGIAAQTICLQASEAGFGTCILGAFDPEEVAKTLRIPKHCQPICAIAFGVPDETVFICNVPPTGDTTYFRNSANLHFVPKRSLEEILL